MWIILILRSKPCVAYVCCVKGPVIIYHGEGGGRSWVGVFRLCQNKIHLIPLRMCNILTFLPRWKSIFCSFSPPPPIFLLQRLIPSPLPLKTVIRARIIGSTQSLGDPRSNVLTLYIIPFSCSICRAFNRSVDGPRWGGRRLGSRSTIEETLNEVPEMKKKETKLKEICYTDKLMCVSLCLSYCNFHGSEVLVVFLRILYLR